MLKVLGLALYGPMAASTRYRLGQYAPGLAEAGIDLQIRHLLGNDYLRERFSGGSLPVMSMVRSALERLKDLWHQRDFDAAIVHCELIPLMPGRLERLLIRRPYIYDFDDAFYLKYRSGRMRAARQLLGDKFDTVIAGAAAVTAGNQILADYARTYNRNTHYLPTVVDTSRYQPHTGTRSSRAFTVGWIGSYSTAAYLREFAVPLSALGQEGQVRFIVMGGKAPKVPNVSVVELDWNESTELDVINSFDVGIMPLPDNDWARGKCGFKLIQYMACAVPVIASPVGANVDILNPDSGFLATTPQEWLDALRILRDQPAVRARMGEAGRARVVQHYSLHKNLPVLAGVIRQIGRTG